MKYNRKVSSSRRTCRKAHFTANDAKRRLIMSSGLSKELREQYVFKSFPVVKGDEVLVLRGNLKGKTGKVVKVNRATYKVVLDISYREKKNGQTASFGICASSLVITKLCMDHNRQALLEKKKAARVAGDLRKKEKDAATA
ncbi:large subunit ribosomal protein L26e [Nematocida sp. ERTm5]|nr:large subunit ribosomal protein L26e [Nematocida sp. AWRm79]KAI5182771.1 large subunit ribosomal protein L26e [Nematocida sp. AWRm78]OAG32502.1 large subunit ribosomal protein L26e [Nematocida sp. ERTm5]